MNFCYYHPTVEAEGKCFQCGNWICIHDYNLLEEKIKFGKRNVEDEPVVLCPDCFNKDTGRKPEHGQVNSSDPNTTVHKTKVLMCFQCGAKINENEKFCPGCGEPTSDEIYDASHPLGGVKSSKES